MAVAASGGHTISFHTASQQLEHQRVLHLHFPTCGDFGPEEQWSSKEATAIVRSCLKQHVERFLLFFQGPPSSYSVSSSRRISLLIQNALELEEMKVPVFIFFARRSLSLQTKFIPGFSSASAVQNASTTGALTCHLWWPSHQQQLNGGVKPPPEVEAPVLFQPKTGWETSLAGPLPDLILQRPRSTPPSQLGSFAVPPSSVESNVWHHNSFIFHPATLRRGCLLLAQQPSDHPLEAQSASREVVRPLDADEWELRLSLPQNWSSAAGVLPSAKLGRWASQVARLFSLQHALPVAALAKCLLLALPQYSTAAAPLPAPPPALHLPLHDLSSDPLADIRQAVQSIAAPFRQQLDHYARDRQQRGLEFPESIHTPSPSHLGELSRGVGDQRGVVSHRLALPRLVPSGLGPDRHLSWALRTSNPFQPPAELADDLDYAVRLHAQHQLRLSDLQDKWLAQVEKLAQLLAPLDRAARNRMQRSVREVAGHRNIAFVEAMIFLARWPDKTLALRLMIGFAMSGIIEECGVFRPSSECISDFSSKEEILSSADAWNSSLMNEKRPKEAEELFNTAKERIAELRAEGLFSKAQLDAEFGTGGWRALPRHRSWHEEGQKWRTILDALRGGQNLAAFCSEKINASGGEVYLNCCRRLRALLGQPLKEDLRVGMAVEDWSMAYDNTPAAPEDYNILISAVFDIHHGEWRFMKHRDNPFGFKASVNNFNRDPELHVGFNRRVFGLITDHFYDDNALIAYLKRSRVQRLLQRSHELSGALLSEKKRQPVAEKRDLLGIHYDFTQQQDEKVFVAPKEGRGQKLRDAATLHSDQQSLSASAAGRFCGKSGFFFQTVAGRIGRSVLGPLRKRQYEPGATTLTQEMDDALSMVSELTLLDLSRVVRLDAADRRGAVIYSDAFFDSRDSFGLGSVQFFLDAEDPHRPSSARFALSPPGVLALFAERKHYSGVLELFAVYMHLYEHRWQLKSRDIRFFVDNVGVLAQLTKGASSAEDLSPIVSAIHFLIVMFDMRIWWEYVESEANISDGLSRKGANDDMAIRLSWKPKPALLPPWGRGWKLRADDCVSLFS